MQRQVAPEHWVRVAKDRGPIIRTADEESLGGPATTWPATAKQLETTPSSPKWAKTSQKGVTRRNTEFPEIEMSSESSNGASFSTSRNAPDTEMHWLSKSGDKTQSVLARVLRWLSARSQAADPRPSFSKPASVEGKTPKQVFPQGPKPHRGNHGPEWHKAEEKIPSAPTVFPGRNGNHAVRASFVESQSQSRRTPLESQFPEQRGSIASSVNHRFFGQHSNPVAEPDINFHEYRADSEWESASWPELPSSMHDTNISLSDRGLSHMAEATKFDAIGPANYWPELGADRNDKEQNWRSLIRTVQRSQRRDREQRGY